MSEIKIEGLERIYLTEEENNALDILINLPLEEFNEIKDVLELDIPCVVGKTTLKFFINFCKDKSLDLSDAGVNQFKDDNKLGNTGVLKGVIGPQTAEFYFNELMSVDDDDLTDGKRHINQAGLDLVKEFEGFHSRRFKSGPKRGKSVPNGGVTAYWCPAKKPTIGYGHTHTVTAADVDVKVISPQEAEKLLRGDLKTAEDAVSNLITVDLNDNEFSALVSFTFNVGAGALKNSTLRRRLNRGDNRTSVANDEFKKWVKGGGKILPGLVKRREAERKLFLS